MLRFIAMMPRAVGIRGSRSNTGDGLAPAASESGLAARAARSFGTSPGVSEKLFSSPFRQTVSLAVAPGVRPRPRLRRSGQNNLRANRVCSGFNAKVDDWTSSELPGARLKLELRNALYVMDQEFTNNPILGRSSIHRHQTGIERRGSESLTHTQARLLQYKS